MSTELVGGSERCSFVYHPPPKAAVIDADHVQPSREHPFPQRTDSLFLMNTQKRKTNDTLTNRATHPERFSLSWQALKTFRETLSFCVRRQLSEAFKCLSAAGLPHE